MSIPKEPRQQLINIMYLVLTALLALNVSSEVLNSFKFINDGLSATNSTINGNNDVLMAGFQQKFINDAKKTGPYLEDARKVKQVATDMNNYIETLKKQIVNESGGEEDGQLVGKKDVETTTRIMVNQKHGQELQQKLQDLRLQLVELNTLTDDERKTLLKDLPISTDYDQKEANRLDKKDWASYHFEKVPVIAAVAMLTKLEGDVTNAEAMVLEKLDGKIEVKTYKFDQLQAASIVPTSYVIAGKQTYKANIFVAATSSTQQSEVYMGQFKDEKAMRDPVTGTLVGRVDEFPLRDGFVQVPVTNGVANFSEVPGKAGIREHQGVIKVKRPSGNEYDYFPFDLKYQAAQSTAVISPVKMNVLYIGLDNPLDISVPGIPAEKLVVTMAGKGGIKGSNGQFFADVTSPGTVTVNVAAKMEDGLKPMGSMSFRVRRVPSPTVIMDNNQYNTLKTGAMKNAQKLNAVLEDFFYSINYKVVDFEATYKPVRQDLIYQKSVDEKIPDRVLEQCRRAKPGDMLYFDNIRVLGPDKQIRVISNVTYKVI